jgi:DNA polymerase-1
VDSGTHRLLDGLACGDQACLCATTLADGKGLTHCPAHDDNTPSLNVTPTDDRLLLHCHTGCTQDAVLSALRRRKLWTQYAHYDYFGADGRLLYQSVRIETPGEKKRFYQRRPVGNGWENHTRGVEHVPYRLPQLLQAPLDREVFVVEGEKDADRLASVGLVATTNVSGAGKWLPEYAQHFRDRHVVVLADNDDAGAAHRNDVVRSLLNQAASVKAPELPGAGPKEDISDLLDRGLTAQDLLDLVSNTPPLTEVPNGHVSVGGEAEDDERESTLGPIPTFPLEVLPRAMRGLVEASNLPNNLLAGAGLAALMSATGGQAEIDVEGMRGFTERANEFIADISPRSTGKSPSLRLMYEPLEVIDRRLRLEYEEERDAWQQLSRSEKQTSSMPVDRSILRSNFTMEAAIRQLAKQPSTTFLVDELSTTLQGFDAYRPDGVGTDRGSILQLWDGGAVRYTRVGRSDGPNNSVDLYVARPTVVLVGGLQPHLQYLLGADEDGLRPRWLVHVAGYDSAPLSRLDGAVYDAWDALIQRLVARRGQPRRWVVGDAAFKVLKELRADWDRRRDEASDVPSVLAAFGKADRHVLRIALALAEAGLEVLPPNPTAMPLPPDMLWAAARWYEFIVASWGSLFNGAPAALSLRDRQIDQIIDRVIPYLEQRGKVSSRQLYTNNVGGLASRADTDAVVERYKSRFPGSVEVVKASTGGRPVAWLHPPRRRITGAESRARAHARGTPLLFEEIEPVSEGAENESAENATQQSLEIEAVYPAIDPINPAIDQPIAGLEAAIAGFEERLLGGEKPPKAPRKRPEKTPKPPKPKAFEDYPTPAWTLVRSPSELAFLAPSLARALVLGADTETTKLHVADGRCRLIQVALDDHVLLLDVDALGTDVVREYLTPLLGSDQGPMLAFTNAPFDCMWLTSIGVPTPPAARLIDTQTAAYLLLACGSVPAERREKTSPRKYGLRDLVKRYLKLGLPKEQQTSDWSADELSTEQLDYAARDAHATLTLALELLAQLRARDLLKTLEFEMACMPAMVELHTSGVLVDRAGWLAQDQAQLAATDRLLQENLIEPYGPHDVSLDQQRAFWRSGPKKLKLLNELGIPAAKFNERELLALKTDHPIVPRLIEWSKSAHNAATYGARYLEQRVDSNGRLHPGWRLLGSDVGRMACLQPNLQNLPHGERYRRLIVAPEGSVFVKVDFATLHLRIAAELAPEPVLIELFRDGTMDPHRLMAARIHRIDNPADVSDEHRRIGKTINFGFLYGAREQRFINEVRAREGIEYTLLEAARFRKAFFDVYPGFRRWHGRYDWDTPQTVVDVHTGRQRLSVYSALEKVNTPVLMIEAAGLKTALQGLMRTHDQAPSALLVMAVHDELIAQCPAYDAERVKAWMEFEMHAAMQALLPRVPVVVESKIVCDYAGTAVEKEVVLAS